MNYRLTAVLFVIVAVIGVTLLILSFIGEEKGGPADVLAKELADAGAKAEDIDSVEMERPGVGTLLLVRTNKERNTWQIQQPITAPADAVRIMPVINALLKAKPTPYSELSSNPATHGLDPPSLKVTLRQGTERSSTINLGDVTIGENGVVFVTTSAQPSRPMAVRRSELNALFRDGETGGGSAGAMAKWTADYRSPSVFPSDSRALGEDVVSLKLALPNKKEEVALSRSGGGWKFDAPAGWGAADSEGDSTGAAKTFTGVNPLLRALTNMSAASPADFIENPGDLKQYGLNPDNPDRVRVEMKAKDGQSAVVYIGKMEFGPPPPPVPGMPPMSQAGGKAYVMIEGQPGVIRATASQALEGLIPVIGNPSPLRDHNLITVDARKQVDGLDILLAGQPADKPTKLRLVKSDPAKPGEWKLYGGPNDPQEADPAAVKRIADVVTARRVIKDFPAPKPEDFASVPVTLFVWVDGFNPPADAKAEPVKRAEPTKIEFGRKEGDTLYVRRTLPGGQVNVFTIPAAVKIGGGTETVDALQAVAKSRLDLLNRSLPSFSDTSRIAVSGDANYVIGQDEKPDPIAKEKLWRYVSPDPRAGRTVDAKSVREDVIYYLANATSQLGQFVNDSPNPNLAEYGLDKPRLKVTVALPSGASGQKELVWEFGKDASEGYVYARVSGKPVIFTIGKTVFDKVVHADLRDRVLFRFDPAKVAAINLRGWGILKLGEQRLQLTRNKDGSWGGTLNNRPFAANSADVNKFLTTLTQLRVKNFIATAFQKKEYGFGDENQLIVELTMSEGPMISMNFGAPTDNGQSYYTFSSTLPASDPFCTVDSAPLKQFKAGPAGFGEVK